jgi:hypothetical protein
VHFTAANKKLGVANRDLGTVQGIEGGRMTVKMDGNDERTISFDTADFRSWITAKGACVVCKARRHGTC